MSWGSGRILDKFMSLVTISLPPYRMSQGPMSHVEFKKFRCRPVNLRGLGPYLRRVSRAAGNAIRAEIILYHPMSNLRNADVALSILGVWCHICGMFLELQVTRLEPRLFCTNPC